MSYSEVEQSYIVPRSLQPLVWRVSGAMHDTHNPTFPHFIDGGDPEEVMVEFHGDPEIGQAIIQTAFAYGAPFLLACKESPDDLNALSTTFYRAVKGIASLNDY